MHIRFDLWSTEFDTDLRKDQPVCPASIYYRRAYKTGLTIQVGKEPLFAGIIWRADSWYQGDPRSIPGYSFGAGSWSFV